MSLFWIGNSNSSTKIGKPPPFIPRFVRPLRDTGKRCFMIQYDPSQPLSWKLSYLTLVYNLIICLFLFYGYGVWFSISFSYALILLKQPLRRQDKDCLSYYICEAVYSKIINSMTLREIIFSSPGSSICQLCGLRAKIRVKKEDS